MKFIYVFHKDVAKDLEKSGLQKYGETIIDGKPVTIFLNNKEIYISKYAKNEILLSNKLFFFN